MVIIVGGRPGCATARDAMLPKISLETDKLIALLVKIRNSSSLVASVAGYIAYELTKPQSKSISEPSGKQPPIDRR